MSERSERIIMTVPKAHGRTAAVLSIRAQRNTVRQ
jgi:hypothetical protein